MVTTLFQGVVRRPLQAKFGPLKNQAIVAMGCSRDPVVLDYVGNAFDYWMEQNAGEDGEYEIADGCNAPGLWYVEGDIHTAGGGLFSLAEDYDERIDNTIARRLTPEELQMYQDGEVTPFELERKACDTWNTIEALAYNGYRLRIDGPWLCVSFPDETPETFESITWITLDIRCLDHNELNKLENARHEWETMKGHAAATKRILAEKAKREDPEWVDSNPAPDESIEPAFKLYVG